jgi:hypothetical protein
MAPFTLQDCRFHESLQRNTESSPLAATGSSLDLHYLSLSFARGMFFLPTHVTRAHEIHPEILTDQNMIASEIS